MLQKRKGELLKRGKDDNMYTFRIYLAKTGKRKQIDTVTSEYVKETLVEWDYFENLCKDGDEFGILHDALEHGYYFLAERVF